MSMRMAASCAHPLQESWLPRGAVMGVYDEMSVAVGIEWDGSGGSEVMATGGRAARFASFMSRGLLPTAYAVGY